MRDLDFKISAYDNTGKAFNDVGKRVAALGSAIDKVTKQASAQRTNLLYQLQDIGVSLAGGMNPLMVMMQQGSQIAMIYGPGGLGKALKETASMAVSAAARFSPLIAVLGVGYGAYSILQANSAEAALAIDSATAALAKQAQPIAAVEGMIRELAGIQEDYAKAISQTGKTQSLATRGIIADSEREFNAKKSLLELELKRQEAAVAAQRAEMQVAQLQLKQQVAQQVLTRNDSERQGFLDPRIGSVPFVQVPDSISGLDKTRDVLAASAINDKVTELRANLDLTEISTEKLREALGQTFDAGVENALKRIAEAGRQSKDAAEKAIDPWRNLRKVSADAAAAMREAQRIEAAVQDAWHDLGERGGSLMNGLITRTLTWQDALKQAIPLLLQLVEQLLFARQIAAGGGGIFGGGVLGGVFGGLLGFDSGGYTGSGPRNRVAGLVHAGEYVFSQDSVRRIGIGNLEAMHRGVGRLTAAAAPQEVLLKVIGEAGPMFIPTIQAESRGVAVQVVKGGIAAYDKVLDKTVGGKVANAKMRQF